MCKFLSKSSRSGGMSIQQCFFMRNGVPSWEHFGKFSRQCQHLFLLLLISQWNHLLYGQGKTQSAPRFASFLRPNPYPLLYQDIFQHLLWWWQYWRPCNEIRWYTRNAFANLANVSIIHPAVDYTLGYRPVNPHLELFWWFPCEKCFRMDTVRKCVEYCYTWRIMAPVKFSSFFWPSLASARSETLHSHQALEPTNKAFS